MSWQTFAVSVITALITSIATTIAATYTYWNTDRSLDIEMVRISLSILSGENQDTSLNGRKFALRSLAKYSDVEIPDDEFEQWALTGTVPEPTDWSKWVLAREGGLGPSRGAPTGSAWGVPAGPAPEKGGTYGPPPKSEYLPNSTAN